MDSIIWLEDIGKKDAAIAGGKGAKLGELLKAGFPVPEGFVVASSVYKAIVNGYLDEKIKESLSSLDVENTKELEETSNKIQSLIISAKLPDGAEADILESYRKLGGTVSVRSSATVEDAKGASFAGQLSTFLNVKEGRLIDSVKKCMASLYTARAIYYRHSRHLGHENVSVAVVVQKMVNSIKSGVAFSINPVTNNSGQIVIEAASGLGESLVSGKTTPDNFVIEKATGKIKKSRTKKTPVLNSAEISQLVEMVKKIENHFDFPQDIEWAIDSKNSLYILQSRPVTTLQAKKKPAWKKILSREYAVQYTELSLKCLSPMNADIVPSSFYEQVYVPENANEACYMDEGRWNEFVSALKEKYLHKPENYGEFEKLFMAAGNDYMKTAENISGTDLKSKSNGELKELYIEYLKKNLRYGPFIWMQFIINNFFADESKEIITGKLGKDDKNLPDFIEIAIKPGKKAASIQLNEIAAGWEKFTSDEKDGIYEKFKWLPCLDIHNRPWTKEEFFSHVNEFRKMENPSMDYEELIKKLRPTKKEKQILNATKRLSYLKDLKDDFRRRGIFFAQKLFEEISSRMGISLHDISFMLEEEVMDFLDKGKKLPSGIIESRKKGFAIYFTPEKKIDCKSGEEADIVMADIGLVVFEDFSEEIRGVAASSGKAKGTVAIVRGISDLAKVRKGDVMVAITTHPDYVPAMQKASAIVTEEGGITSHAAIVARELGLPCIVGAKHATKSLRNGDIVEIDADAGLVRKIKK